MMRLRRRTILLTFSAIATLSIAIIIARSTRSQQRAFPDAAVETRTPSEDVPKWPESNSPVRVHTRIEQNGLFGLVDASGQILVPPKFEHLDNVFSEGLTTYRDSGQYGFIDEKGHIIIPAQFRRANLFQEGRAAVQINDKFGYIDRTGAVVIRPVFDSASYFRSGVARVGIETRSSHLITKLLDVNETHAYRYINLHGEYISDDVGRFQYENSQTPVHPLHLLHSSE